MPLAKKFKLLLLVLALAGFSCWAVIFALWIELPSEKNPLIFYSNQKRDDLKQILCRALKEARHSILIHIYGLTDPDILALLKEKKSAGVAITLFYDENASPDIAAEFQNKLALYPIKTSGLMHRKILSIDNQTVYIGTANFTPQSLRMHDNLIVGIHHAGLAHYLVSCLTLDFGFALGAEQFEFYLLPDFEKKAVNRLVNLIEQAQKTISIAMFTLTHPLLTKKLIEAHQRGVEVKIAVDYFTGHGSSSKTVEKLQKEGIKIYFSQGDALLHHKWALIDETTLAMGSANWTTAAFKNNQDCLLIIRNLGAKQKKFLGDLWNIIESDCIHQEYEDLLSLLCPIYFDGPDRKHSDLYCCFEGGRSQKAEADHLPRALYRSGGDDFFLFYWRLPTQHFEHHSWGGHDVRGDYPLHHRT